MKLVFKFSLLTFLLLRVSHAHSQRITKVGQNKFAYNDGEYEFQDMEDVFISKFDSYLEFQSAVKSRANTRFLGYTTLAAMGVGTLAPIIDPYDGCGGSFCLTTGQIIGLFSWLVVVPVTGTIGIITRIRYIFKKKKTMSLFNDAQDFGHLVDSSKWNVSVGVGQYGYGIVVNF